MKKLNKIATSVLGVSLLAVMPIVPVTAADSGGAAVGNTVTVYCATGGNGAQSCTYSYTFFFMSQEHSVSCSPGYFACCNPDGARCYKEPTKR